MMVAVAILFSTGGAAVKLSALSAWQLAGARSLVAAVVLAALIPQARRRWTGATLMVGLAYAATLVLFVHANKLTTAASTIFLQGTAPFWVILAGPLLLRERSKPRDLGLAAFMALAMVALLSNQSDSQTTAPNPVLGNTLALLSGASYSMVILGLRWLTLAGSSTDEHEGLRAVVCGNLLAGLGCTPGAWSEGGAAAISRVFSEHPWEIAVVCYLGVFQIGLAYWLMTRAVRRLRAVETALLLLLEPILSPFWAGWAVGELPALGTWIGGVLVILATACHAIAGAKDPPGEDADILRE